LGATAALAVPLTGTVTGTFTVPAGTAAPSDVTVELLTPEGGTEATATVTNTNATTGTYTASVEPGTYYVYFIDRHAGDNVQADYAGDGGSETVQSASRVTVTAGSTTTVAATALHAGAVISGTVSDANKGNEADATVYLYPVVSGTLPDPQIDEFGTAATVTLGTGAWSVAGMPPGSYLLGYRADGAYTNGDTLDIQDAYVSNGSVTDDYGSGAYYSVPAGGHTTVDFSVPALAIISGTVSGPAGPLFDVQVQSFDGIGSSGPSAFTAADGSYSMSVLPGTYKLWAESIPAQNLGAGWYGGGATEAQATAVNAADGASVGGINLTLGAGGMLTGTVVAAQGGAPVGGIEVDVLDAQGQYITNSYTLPNGTYAIADVPAGTWYVRFAGGQASNGSFYAASYYGGTLTEFGATAVTVTGDQTTAGVNGFMLPEGTGALRMPTASAAALSGLHDDKVALRFKVAAGAGAGYLKMLTVGLPKGFSWNRRKLAADLSLGAGISFSDVITRGKLVITLAGGVPSVALSLKAGGITVTKAIEKAAGGSTGKKGKKGKMLAISAKAKKKPKKPKDTIRSETIGLSVADTTGMATSLPITIKHPS
jgi:hypothetical protein